MKHHYRAAATGRDPVSLALSIAIIRRLCTPWLIVALSIALSYISL